MDLHNAQGDQKPAKKDSTFHLVNSVVTDLLVKGDDSIRLNTQNRKFFSDLTTTVGIGDTISISIDSVEHQEQGFNEEITISGSLKDNTESLHTFTLYFIMEKETLFIPRGDLDMGKLIGQTINVPMPGGIGVLHHSVFKMKLDCIDCNNDTHFFGEGRGYFIFNNKANTSYSKNDFIGIPHNSVNFIGNRPTSLPRLFCN